MCAHKAIHNAYVCTSYIQCTCIHIENYTVTPITPSKVRAGLIPINYVCRADVI